MHAYGYLSALLVSALGPTSAVALASANDLFNPPVLPTGSQPISFLMADVSGDALPDLVITNQSPTHGIAVFVGDADGGFAPRVETAIPSSGRALASGDLDGDGDVDLFVGNAGGGSGYVLLNTPVGFIAQPIAASIARSAAIADFDADGNLDILVGSQGNGSTDVFWNSGAAVFNSSDGIPGGGTVAVGDLNGDDRPDWVAVDPNSAQVTIIKNLGARQFQRSVAPVGMQPFDVALGDVNGDGALDVVTANFGSDTISVLWNDGNGVFLTRADFSAGINPSSVVITDLTRDGHPDVVVGNDHQERITVLENNGVGWFFSAYPYVVGDNPLDVIAEDLNQDGCPDLLVLIEGSPGYAQILVNRRCSSSVECPADLNRDGVVNILDFNWFAADFGITCP